MRQLQPNERGSANWPFIITLILLLVFVYMWFDQTDQKDKALTDTAKATANETAARKAATRILQEWSALSKDVGWVETNAQDFFKDDATILDDAETKDVDEAKAHREEMAFGRALAGDYVVTNREKLAAQLSANGTDGARPGMVNFLINGAQLDMKRELWAVGGDERMATDMDFSWMSTEFRQALAKLNSLEMPTPPTPPIDPDNPGDVSRYEDGLATYEEAVAAYQAALKEAQEMPEWTRLKQIVTGPSILNPAEAPQVITLDFFTQSLTPRVTVEDAMRYPQQVIEAILAEFARNKASDAGAISSTRQDNTAKDESINELQSQLADEQTRHTSDVQRLQDELSQANEVADRNRRDATTAKQQLQVAQDEARRAVAERESRISALENRIRVDKEVRDLEIRRDDPDGEILSASSTMGTAIINLGSRDKVYTGLKFDVSYMARGGIRTPKGQVQVIRVIDRGTAQVRILAAPGGPITRGDMISNPFYSVTEEIHVWLAGELGKYPQAIAEQRLGKMGVIIDEELSGDTDYVVVPDSMTAPAPTGDEEEMGEEPAVGALSPFERVQRMATTFGATVISERMLNIFLDY